MGVATWLCCCLQRAAPMGLSPLPLALPLTPSAGGTRKHSEAGCGPLRPLLLLVLFPCLRSPVVGVPGLCWMWRVPFMR